MNPQSETRSFSFELFPPKTPEGMEKLKATVTELNTVGPSYFSCTYGAGGSTREGTFETIEWLRAQGIETAPHLACIGSDKDEIREIIAHYIELGTSSTAAPKYDKHPNVLVVGIGIAISDTDPDPEGRQPAH
jgi:methylenetetrahydrofolate reductase (NADPH)